MSLSNISIPYRSAQGLVVLIFLFLIFLSPPSEDLDIFILKIKQPLSENKNSMITEFHFTELFERSQYNNFYIKLIKTAHYSIYWTITILCFIRKKRDCNGNFLKENDTYLKLCKMCSCFLYSLLQINFSCTKILIFQMCQFKMMVGFNFTPFIK